MEIFLRHTAKVVIRQSMNIWNCTKPLQQWDNRIPMLCSRCQVLQAMQFHTSSPVSIGKARNTKKKLVKVVKLRQKSLAMSREVVTIWPNMTVQELAASMDKDVDHVFEVFMFVNNADKYDDPTSAIDDMKVIKDVLDKSGFRHKMREKKKDVHKEDKDAYKRAAAGSKDMVRRPPVVTIMGHVDHGKTTLLDALRHTNVVAQEFGGITQHIGAFSVKMPSGEQLTFLDTPGHAAFSAMRARGAHVTDIVVLVVAADDGVMKQTAESIRFATEANVPIIVAINKIDKAVVDIEGTKRDLLQYGIQLEDNGGDVQAVPISALKGTNLDQLQEAIAVQAELLEIKADKCGLVEAVVIESRTDLGRGKLSTVLINRGTLKRGACLVAGNARAKVRGMFNDKGRPVQEVGPGMAAEVIGWKELPSAGDLVLQVESEHRAQEVIHYRNNLEKAEKVSADEEMITKKVQEHQEEYQRLRQERLAKGYRTGSIYKRISQKEVIETHTGPELAIVLKGDVDGSVEAILDLFDTYNSDQCRLHLLSYGVGPVTEHDIEMAASFNGLVYAFNVKTNEATKQRSRQKNVTIYDYNVIYKLFDDIKEQLNKRIPTTLQDEIVGQANVLALFMVTDGKKKIPIAGCRCIKGMLQKKMKFKLIRDGEVLIDGPLSSLKHLKNEVESIKNDVECGLCFKDISEIPQPGDTIQCYHQKEIKQQIQWDLDF